MKSAFRWASLAACAALAVGLLVGTLAIPPLPPQSGTAAPTSRSVIAVERTFDASQTVSSVPTIADKIVVLTSGASGTVTSSACSSGSEVKTGDTPFTVNGRPLVAVASSVPLWRDLSVGTQGSDVRGLQDALVAAGYQTNASGTYDRTTLASVRSLQSQASVAVTGRIALGEVQWVPAAAGPIASCEAQIGGIVSPAQPLLTMGGGLVAIAVPSAAGLLPDRPYVAVAGESTAPVPEDGRIVDPAFLTAVVNSQSYAEWIRDPNAGVALTVRLADPLSAWGLSPSAVVLAGPDKGCVVTPEGRQVPVEVLASELGTVFVIPDDPITQVVIPASGMIDVCE